jgi:hypothetical protein
LITSKTFINNRNNSELITLLAKKGILGCEAIAKEVKIDEERVAESRKRVHLGNWRGRKVVAFKCEECNALGAGTLIQGKGGPFLANIIGYCPPLIRDTAKSSSLGFEFKDILDRGTIVVEALDTDTAGMREGSSSQQGTLSKLEPSAKVEVVASNSIELIAGMKELHRMGRLAGDYSLNQYLISGQGEKQRIVFNDVDCMAEGYQEGNMAGDFECLKAGSFQEWTKKAGVTPRRDVGYVVANVCVILRSVKDKLTNTQQKGLAALYASAADLKIKFTLDDAVDALVEIFGLAINTSQGTAEGVEGTVEGAEQGVVLEEHTANPVNAAHDSAEDSWGGVQGALQQLDTIRHHETQKKRVARLEQTPCKSKRHTRSTTTGKCVRKASRQPAPR